MASSDDDTHFDVLVLSTDLAASIAAAALARAGLRVLHVDENEFYGGEHASLAPDELLRHPACTSPSQELPPYARQYAIALAPAVINATGPLITSIVASGVSRYGGYKLLDALALAPPLRAVPGSKEDVFRSRDLTLPEKHHLMKFLLFAAGEEPLADDDEARRPFGAFLRERFKLGDRTADAVVYAIAQCSSSQEAAGSALARTRAFIRSSGRYGNSPFLLPYYGGLGEIAQGFCRTCAVHGGVYILGRKMLALSRSSAHSPAESHSTSPSQPESQTQSESQVTGEGDAEGGAGDSGDTRWSITLDGVPDTLTASVLLSSRPRPPSQPHETLHCRVALTDRPLALPDVDDALVVFPPSPSSSPSSSPNQNENEKENESVVRALITGPKSMSAPPGHWVVHVFATTTTSPEPESTPASASDLLQPHLDTLLGGHAPIFTASFTLPVSSSSSAPSSSSSSAPSSTSTTQPTSESPADADVLLDALPLGAPAELGDAAALAAQKAFWAVVGRLGKQDEVLDFWPEVEKDGEEGEDEADW